MGKFIFGQEYKCSAQLAIAVEGLFKAARVGLVIPALLHAAPAKLHTALRCVSRGMDGIWGYHLWFLSVRYFISPGTPRAQAWKCLWHSLMLMWVFRAPLLHSCFSFPHVLLGSDLLCFFFFFPTFWFYGKSHPMEQQEEGSQQKAICLLSGWENRTGLRIFYLLSILPRLLVELQGALRRRGCSLIPLPWNNYTEIN